MNISANKQEASSGANLDFVPPEKRAEVARRIAVIERFLEGGGGTTLAAKLAPELGLSLAHFYTLVRIWSGSRDPVALYGSGRPKADHDRLRDEQRQVIDEAIKRLIDGTHEDIARLAMRIGARRAVTMPIFSTVRKYVRRQRRARLPSSSPAFGVDLVIEHCAINVGTIGPNGAAYRPIATICTSVHDAICRSVWLSRDRVAASATAKAMVETLSDASFSGDGTGSFAIYLDLLDGPEWDRLGNTLAAAGIERVGKKRSSVRLADATLALLGSRIAGLTLHPRTTNRPFQDRPARLRPGASPVSLEEAEAYVRARLLNRDRPPLELAGPQSATATEIIRQLSLLSE